MVRMCMSVLVSCWLMATPFLWAHRPEKAAVALGLGFLGIVLGALAMFGRPLRTAFAALGAALLVSTFVFPDGFATIASDVVAAALMMALGMLDGVKRGAAAAPVASNEIVTPRDEEKNERFRRTRRPGASAPAPGGTR